MNKAIILAGGKGTRLSPLTDGIPKPLMPFHGTSLCEHIISRLSSHGINEIMISVGYRGDMIIDRIGNTLYGANIHYLEETVPLGTAGGLKYAKKLLNLEDNEPIFIISGDCVCDFDINAITEHHKNNSADATVVTVECEEPLEYGVVLSDGGGLICGFNEKPPWSQVNCNRVNTGIYVINSSVIDMIPPGQYDFSKDLFPKMLRDGKKLAEYCADGYWCDIGNVESYYKSCIDAINGKIKNFTPQNSANIEALSRKGVNITLPCYIHESCVIESGASIGPNTSVGANCKIGKNSTVAGSIVHENTEISDNCRIQGTIICANCVLDNGVAAGGGTVIAEGTHIPADSILSSNSKITHDIETASPCAVFGCKKGLYLTDNGISLGKPEKFSASACERLGRAVASASGKFARIGAMHDNSAHSYLFAKSILSGIERSGVMSYNFGSGFFKLARYSAFQHSTDCFLYVEETNGEIFCKLFNKNGLPPSRDYERRLFKAYDDAEREKCADTPLPCTRIDSAENSYICGLLDNARAYCGDSGFDGLTAAFQCDKETRDISLLKKTFLDMGGVYVEQREAHDKSALIIQHSEKDGISIKQSNYFLDKHHIVCEIIKAERELGAADFVLPHIAPSACKQFCGSAKILNYPTNSGKRFNIPHELLRSCYYMCDDIMLCARFLSLLARDKKNLSEYSLSSPSFAYVERTIEIPAHTAKTVIIKKLSHNSSESFLQDSYEGIKICHPDGTVTVVPGRSQCFKIYSEAKNTEVANELCDEVCAKINENIGNSNTN